MSEEKSAVDKLATKKEIVQGTPRHRPLPLILLALAALLVVGGVFFFTGSTNGIAKSGGPSALTTQTAAAGEVRYPATDFTDGKARYYEHTTVGGLLVKYFIVQADDGVIRAAFDACDACWRAGKGYWQEGNEMVCRNCRMRFPTDQINEVKGGCNPSPLERRIEDGEVVIRVSDIEAGAGYFDFSKRKKGK